MPAAAPGFPDPSLSGASTITRADIPVRTAANSRLFLYSKPYSAKPSAWVARDTGVIITGVPAVTADPAATYIAGYSPDQTLAFLNGQPGAMTVSHNVNQKLVFDPAIIRDPNTGLIFVFTIDRDGALVELRRTLSDQWSVRLPAFP